MVLKDFLHDRTKRIHSDDTKKYNRFLNCVTEKVP